MAEWRRICCAVDFSEPSRRALEEAADLARRFASDLTALHVYDVLPPTGLDLLGPPVEEAQRSAAQVMEQWVRDAELIARRAVRSALRIGAPAQEILRFAREGSFDLLVLATQGRTGLKRLVLGSVAERVVREAECAVLVVR